MMISTNQIVPADQSTNEISEAAATVKAALLAHGLETPLVNTLLNNQQKYDKIQSLMAQVMTTLGLDINDDSLQETPHRIAKMYIHEIFSGLDYQNFPALSLITNKMGSDEMVRIRDITLTSTCEHHFVTIDGFANVAYIPSKTIIGLSKINRIVQFFAKRPQIQERLTRQILVSLQTLLDTDNVAVAISATHYCVKSRGVVDTASATDTYALGGLFKTDATCRQEFLK